MKFLSYSNPFRLPSSDQQILKELEEAKCKLLEAKTGQEFATALVQYNVERVVRLQRLAAQIGHPVNPREFLQNYEPKCSSPLPAGNDMATSWTPDKVCQHDNSQACGKSA